MRICVGVCFCAVQNEPLHKPTLAVLIGLFIALGGEMCEHISDSCSTFLL